METQRIIARQPIFDKRQRTIGYELLFRTHKDEFSFSHSINGKTATLSVINTFVTIGLENLTGGKRAFVNFERETLTEEFFRMLPAEQLVIEVLEDIEIAQDLLEICKKAKRDGFTIALDDFSFREEIMPLAQIADIIKIDIKKTSEKEINSFLPLLKKAGKILLAEKVETPEEFQKFKKLGFDCFQGFFFSHPKILTDTDIPPFKRNLLQIIKEIQKGAPLEKMSEMIANDLALSWKLLRYLNSAFFGLRSPVSSVQKAAVLLGEKELRKWLMMVILSEMGIDQPLELVIQSVFRARFCETIGKYLNGEELPLKAFTTGMFSLLDVILQKPMDELLEQIPLEEDIKKALLKEKNLLGKILQLVVSHEDLDIKTISYLIENLNLEWNKLDEANLNAIIWTSQFFGIYSESSKI